MLPPILQAYRETRPQIDVRLREGRQPDILEDVRSGVADFGVGFVDGLPSGFSSVTLRREPLQVVVPATHPLASRRHDQLRLADLAPEKMVSLPVDSYTRRLIDGAAATAGLHIRHALVVTRFESVVHYVRMGAGVGVVPAGALPDERDSAIRTLKLVEPSLSVTLGLITLSGRYMTPAAEGLVQLIKDRVRAPGSGVRAPGRQRATPKPPRPKSGVRSPKPA